MSDTKIISLLWRTDSHEPGHELTDQARVNHWLAQSEIMLFVPWNPY
jgi:hypothetical protein